MNDTCTCGDHFLDAEDFRDHMPCPGSNKEQATNALFDLVRKVDAATPYVVASPEINGDLQKSRDRAVVLLRSLGYWK